MSGSRISSLLDYVRSEERVCPMPGPWMELRELLGQDSPQIAILGGWWAVPPVFKALILHSQIEYAAKHGKLARVDLFVRALEPEQWLRLQVEAKPPPPRTSATLRTQLAFEF